MKLTHISSACLPALRPTSSRRIRPVFSDNTEYQHTNTDLLFRLRFIYYTMVSPFILPCLPFLWLVNEKVRNCSRGVDKFYAFYLLCHANAQTHMCLIASSIKIITESALAYAYSSQPGWFNVEIYMRVLGLSFVNIAVAKIVIKHVGR